MQAQKFYTGTKKRCSSSLHLFFTGSIEVYVRYRADFLALKKLRFLKKFLLFGWHNFFRQENHVKIGANKPKKMARKSLS